MTTIPAFLCVDVEPDVIDPPLNEPSAWHGYEAVDRQLEQLRGELQELTGASTNFSWYFRMDPQIAVMYPSPDHAVSAYPDRVERLAELGDAFGIHVHPQRWSDDRACWIDDYADRAWNLECIERAFAAYAGFFGEVPVRHRYGGGFLNNEHIDLLERLGVRVDLTPERRFIPEELRLHPRDSHGRTGGQRTGVLPDSTRGPGEAYRPSQADPLVADDRNGREIVLVPLTSARMPFNATPWRRIASRLKHPMARAPWRVLYPHARWPDPREYWDHAMAAVDSMSRPHLALAIRTNGPDSEAHQHARRVLEALPAHPLARRLHFLDPLEVAPALLAPVARAGLPAFQ